jgi:radical SAM protein with 4Fe4S-binding SPASM domain
MLSAKARSFLKHYFVAEPDYFTVGGRAANFFYFLRQGNLLAHVVDRIKFRVFPKLLIVARFPTHVDVELASNCQMRCPMCYTTYMANHLKGVMKWELFTKIVDECAERKVYSIKLSWRGEPLLNKHTVEMVRYAKQKGIREVAFLTNAELLTKEIAEQLVDAGLDWMSVSADGVGNIYNEIRAPAIFEETLARVRYMKEYRDRKGLKKPLLRVQSIMSAVERDPEAYRSAWSGIVDRINIIADNIRDFDAHPDLEFDPYFVCPKAWERMTVAYDGRIHQCNTDYAARMVLGDVNKQSLYDIWHGEGENKVRDAFRRHRYLDELPACRQCSYGLVTESARIAFDRARNEMHVRRYKSVPKVVDEEGVRLKTPVRNLPARHRKALGKISKTDQG